jgi:hypothetical protein
MHTERTWLFAEIIIVAASFGCGGRTTGGPTLDGGTGGGCVLAPGLDDNARFDQLTPDQVTRYCAAEGAFLECEMGSSLKPVICTIGGVAAASIASPTTDEELRSACRSFFATCMASPPMTRCSVEKAATCAATVAQAIPCSEDLVAQVASLKDLDSCDKATLETISRFSFARPASCRAIDAICPSR